VFASLFRQASLREDYLNQVQRDFLSLSLAAKTPLADVTAKFKRSHGLNSTTHLRVCANAWK
jgi:hypothetical protein